jgi:hypothetical protein
MKKKHYLIIACIGLLAAATFSACSKDDDDEGGEDLYRPSQDMSSEEILTLFEEVTANMATVRQVSMQGTTTGKMNGMTMSASMMAQIDFDAKKEVIVEYDVDRTIGRFQYAENDKAYEYESANYNGDKEIKHSYKLSDAYWNRMADVSELESAFNLEWEVKNSTFTGSLTESGVLMKMTVTITPSKRIAGIKIESSYQDESTTVDFKYSYTAVNPVPPAGFTLSEFPPAQQYSIKVVWGEGLGESTFYTEPNYGYFYLGEIIECAPAVSGKAPVLYRDSNFTQSITGSSITVTNNNTVIYVKWEASASARKSVSRPITKSHHRNLIRAE